MFGDGCLGWNFEMARKTNVVFDSLGISSSMDVRFKSKVILIVEILKPEMPKYHDDLC